MKIFSMIHVGYRNLFVILIFLVCIDSIPSQRPFHVHGRGALAYSTEINIQCFSSDSLILLSNGEEKEISSLKIGDEIITIDETNIISTKIILMLDQNKSKKVLFYTLKTQSGYSISLTKNHLIPIKSLKTNFNYLFAKQIQIGDLLYLLNNNQIEYSSVINITIENKIGYYAPLTIKGTLLVNQILSSCFANINNHHLAQIAMFPFRFYYQLTKSYSFSDDKSEGLHWIISILFHLTRYFLPQTLILS